MVKYRLSAMALKALSSCAPTRRLYRRLGNLVGGRKRSTGKIPSYYFDGQSGMWPGASSMDRFGKTTWSLSSAQAGYTGRRSRSGFSSISKQFFTMFGTTAN